MNNGAKSAGAVLEVIGVEKRYGGIVALSNISLTLQVGEIRGLIGPNGAGKTTLFDVLAGAQQPTAGSVLLDGTDITGRSPTWRARRGIRRTFQRQQLFGWLSVEDNVLVALEWQAGGGITADLIGLARGRRTEHRRREQVDAALGLVGLVDDRNRLAGHLSIGEARLVELARALVCEPRVLLLDEPTSGLEPTETERLGELLAGLQATQRCAVAIVEHDVPFVMKHADYVTVLDRGALIADGTPEEVQADPRVQSAYLGI